VTVGQGLTLKGNGALGGQVSKFDSSGLKRFLDPKCVDANAIILSTIPAKTRQKLV
jgi:hypothetical protein